MARARAILILVTVLLWSQGALADELSTARGQNLVETSHQVQVTLKDGIAKYRVRRTFQNRGTEAEEARLRIDLPHGAVATGLRIFAGGKWQEGDLMHRDKAEALYRELTGLGPSRPKDPALLYWTWTSELGLRVFPIFPKSQSLVEYTLTLPTHYEGGRHFVSYPRKHADSPLAVPVVTIETGSVATLDGQAHRSRVIHLRPIATHPVIEQLGREGDRTLVRTLNLVEASETGAVAIDVDIEHTWAGDVELELVDPKGEVHTLRHYDLYKPENDIKARFVVPYPGDQRGAWHLLLTDHHPLDGGRLLSWTLSSHDSQASPESQRKRGRSPSVSDKSVSAIPQPNPSQGDVATVEVETADRLQSSLRFGRVSFSEVPFFARVEMDLAEQLSELPRNHRVTFVLDLSHTMGESGIAAQLRLAKAYLAHVPNSRFVLIGTARTATPLTAFEGAGQFDTVVQRLEKSGAFVPQNGSFLDKGMSEARAVLSGAPAQGKGARDAIVVFTDDRLRPVWNNELALSHVGQLSKDTVLHVVDIAALGSDDMVRDDEHRLFPIARERGGVAVQSRGVAYAKWPRLVEDALYLVRPNRLDHVSFSALSDELEEMGPSLMEGEGIRWMGRVDRLPETMSMSGQLWSRKVTFAEKTPEDFHRATAGFVFSLDFYHELSELQQYVIATYAGAVSPVTSYLAIEPGVRPSTIGLERGLSGVGFGSGFGVGMGRLGGSQSRPTFDWTAIADRAKAACVSQRTTAEGLHLIVDTNDHEIADVRSPETLDAFGVCVVEEIWKEQLPAVVKGDRSRHLTI